MEIEATAPLVAKKLLNILRIVMIMLRKGIAKSKVMAEFHLLLKRGKLAAAKAIANTLTLHHHYAAAFACRRSSTHNNNLSFLSPRDYEFSCSNSPAVNHHHHHRHHRRHRHHHGRFSKQWGQHNDVSTLSAVQKVIEMLNNNNSEVVVEGNYYNSPLVALPGFGKSPIGKQLRITDSPFPLKDEEGDDDSKIDVAAEEFIKRFYKNLQLQHMNVAPMESPYSYHNSWDR